MHRLLAVAARLLAFVESLALRHRDVHTVRRAIRLNPSRSMVSAPFALIHANDPVLVPSGPNPLVMFVRHLLLLVVTVCLQDLFFVAIISVASSSWPDLRSDHRSAASRDRWLSSPSLPCSAHLCLAVWLCSFHSFLIVLAILPCSWVRSSAPHVVDCCAWSGNPQPHCHVATHRYPHGRVEPPCRICWPYQHVASRLPRIDPLKNSGNRLSFTYVIRITLEMVSAKVRESKYLASDSSHCSAS